MDGRKNNRGTIGNKGGRKPKDEEQKAIEKLKPYDDEAVAMLIENVRGGKHWALKLFFEYRFSKPVQTTDIKIGEMKMPEWMQSS